MLTKTIGQLSAATSVTGTDLIEIEQSGVSKYGSVSLAGVGMASASTVVSAFSTALAATSAQSVAGSSNSVFITPATLRAGINAENEAPIYACRAWCTFDGTTTSSSLSGTYTRVVGTTQTVCVATAHGMITGNVQYIDFVTGGASDNTYIVTVVDQDTFTVNTVSTSSILTSTLSLKRCPISAGGNVGSVSREGSATYYVNFASPMPTIYPNINGNAAHTGTAGIVQIDSVVPPTLYAIHITTRNGSMTGTEFAYTTVGVIA